MSEPRLIPAASCLRSARLFNYFCIGSTVLAGSLFLLGNFMPNKKMSFLPLAMSLPPVMLWLAASIFVYAAIAHHPHPRVRHYTKWAGYRYYAIVGALTIFANDLAHLPTGWSGVWILFFATLIPWSLYDIWQAGREDWQDTPIPEGTH